MKKSSSQGPPDLNVSYHYKYLNKMFLSSSTIITTDNNESDVDVRSYQGDISDININKTINEKNNENHIISHQRGRNDKKINAMNFHNTSIPLSHRIEGWNILNSKKVLYRKSLFYIKNRVLALEKEGEKILNTVNKNDMRKRKWVENSMKIFESSFEIAFDVQANSITNVSTTLYCMMLQFTVDLRDNTLWTVIVKVILNAYINVITQGATNENNKEDDVENNENENENDIVKKGNNKAILIDEENKKDIHNESHYQGNSEKHTTLDPSKLSNQDQRFKVLQFNSKLFLSITDQFSEIIGNVISKNKDSLNFIVSDLGPLTLKLLLKSQEFGYLRTVSVTARFLQKLYSTFPNLDVCTGSTVLGGLEILGLGIFFSLQNLLSQPPTIFSDEKKKSPVLALISLMTYLVTSRNILHYWNELPKSFFSSNCLKKEFVCEEIIENVCCTALQWQLPDTIDTVTTVDLTDSTGIKDIPVTSHSLFRSETAGLSASLLFGFTFMTRRVEQEDDEATDVTGGVREGVGEEVREGVREEEGVVVGGGENVIAVSDGGYTASVDVMDTTAYRSESNNIEYNNNDSNNNRNDNDNNNNSNNNSSSSSSSSKDTHSTRGDSLLTNSNTNTNSNSNINNNHTSLPSTSTILHPHPNNTQNNNKNTRLSECEGVTVTHKHKQERERERPDLLVYTHGTLAVHQSLLIIHEIALDNSLYRSDRGLLGLFASNLIFPWLEKQKNTEKAVPGDGKRLSAKMLKELLTVLGHIYYLLYNFPMVPMPTSDPGSVQTLSAPLPIGTVELLFQLHSYTLLCESLNVFGKGEVRACVAIIFNSPLLITASESTPLKNLISEAIFCSEPSETLPLPLLCPSIPTSLCATTASSTPFSPLPSHSYTATSPYPYPLTSADYSPSENPIGFNVVKLSHRSHLIAKLAAAITSQHVTPSIPSCPPTSDQLKMKSLLSSIYYDALRLGVQDRTDTSDRTDTKVLLEEHIIWTIELILKDLESSPAVRTCERACSCVCAWMCG